VKRTFDFLASAAALVILLPLMAGIAVLIWLNLGRPILFRQLRPGMKGVPFGIIKFRTMRIDPAAGSGIDSDGMRLTRLGKLLRATSLDELPELWNVLRGDMSLVGPRPLLMQYLDRYTSEQARRHAVRPGLTGWAQINGRNSLSWERKFELDVWYVENQTFWLDLKILFMTVWRVIRPTGITAEGAPTMPEFMGSPPEAAPQPGMLSRDSGGER